MDSSSVLSFSSILSFSAAAPAPGQTTAGPSAQISCSSSDDDGTFSRKKGNNVPIFGLSLPGKISSSQSCFSRGTRVGCLFGVSRDDKLRCSFVRRSLFPHHTCAAWNHSREREEGRGGLTWKGDVPPSPCQYISLLLSISHLFLDPPRRAAAAAAEVAAKPEGEE